MTWFSGLCETNAPSHSKHAIIQGFLMDRHLRLSRVRRESESFKDHHCGNDGPQAIRCRRFPGLLFAIFRRCDFGAPGTNGIHWTGGTSVYGRGRPRQSAALAACDAVFDLRRCCLIDFSRLRGTPERTEPRGNQRSNRSMDQTAWENVKR